MDETKPTTPIENLVPATPPAAQVENPGVPEKSPKGNKFIPIIICICLIAIFCIGWYWYAVTQKNTISSSSAPSSTAVQPQKVLYVGENIDEDGIIADTKEFQPFIDYLVTKLHAYGYTKGKFIGTKSVTEMTEMVREGKIDVIIDSAFPVYAVDNLTGAVPLADRWKGGAETYHTVIFVKQDSPIRTVDDLKGKMLAFDSSTSTVGYFLPKATLINQGYTLTEKQKPTDPVAPNEIGYTFVHGSVYDSVAEGLTPAGAESELEVNAHFGSDISKYRFVFTSPDILRFLVATRKDLDPKVHSTIADIIFGMDKTPEGQKVLKSFADTAKFTPVQDSDAAYGAIKDLSNVVEQEIITAQ